MTNPAGYTDEELAYHLNEARAVVNELVAEENLRSIVRDETDRVLVDIDKVVGIKGRHLSNSEKLADVERIVRDAKARTGRDEDENDDI